MGCVTTRHTPTDDMYLRKITTRNLQSHKEVVIDLPPQGFVVFMGDNSNGKSVIRKVTQDTLRGELSKPIARASLVNRDASYGEIEYVRDDDVTLLIHISRAANLTYVTLTVPGEEPITRYLADKSYRELLTRFGWHYDDYSGVSLNLAVSGDALLFYNTSNKVNGSIIRTATSDSSADKVAEKFEETLKEARSYRESSIQQLMAIKTAMDGLKTEPVEPLIERRDKLSWCLRNLEHIMFPRIPEVKPVPNVRFVDIKYPTISEIRPVPDVSPVKISYPRIPEIKFPRILSLPISVPDITHIAQDLKALREHRCPTCGRRLGCEC